MLASLYTNTVLGSAAPNLIRPSDGTAVSGQMEFDIADVQALINDGRFDAVVLHELAVSLFPIIVVTILFAYPNRIFCSLMM